MARRGPQRSYSFDGYAGCVTRFKSRATGTLVGLYASDEAGMECDPEFPWTTVCEAHNALVSHASLSLAMQARDPSMWCEECQSAQEREDGS